MDSFKKNGSAVFVSADDPLPVTATVNVGDVEMGAVEIKDATGATRAVVTTAAPGGSDAGLVTRVAGTVATEIANDVGNPIPVSGTVTASGPVTDTQLRATPVPVATTEARPATAVITSVASSASTGVLKASNTARLGLTIFNDSTAALYVAFAATASTSAFTVKIGAGGYYELPRPVYTGAISGIWASANGNARVTEVTA